MIGVRGAVATQVHSPVTALTPVRAKHPLRQINLPSAILTRAHPGLAPFGRPYGRPLRLPAFASQPAISWAAAKIDRARSAALHLE
jgi:hypothetical protein